MGAILVAFPDSCMLSLTYSHDRVRSTLLRVRIRRRDARRRQLLAVDDFEIRPTTAVNEVRKHLRGDPGTQVSITFLREGAGRDGKNHPQTITLERAVVRIPDVKYFGKFDLCVDVSGLLVLETYYLTDPSFTSGFIEWLR